MFWEDSLGGYPGGDRGRWSSPVRGARSGEATLPHSVTRFDPNGGPGLGPAGETPPWGQT